MCDDPTNLTEEGHAEHESWLDSAAKLFGFDSWVHAFHADTPEKRNRLIGKIQEQENEIKQLRQEKYALEIAVNNLKATFGEIDQERWESKPNSCDIGAEEVQAETATESFSLPNHVLSFVKAEVSVNSRYPDSTFEDIYTNYKRWCHEQCTMPYPTPKFLREMGALGYFTYIRHDGEVCYAGISMLNPHILHQQARANRSKLKAQDDVQGDREANTEQEPTITLADKIAIAQLVGAFVLRGPRFEKERRAKGWQEAVERGEVSIIDEPAKPTSSEQLDWICAIAKAADALFPEVETTVSGGPAKDEYGLSADVVIGDLFFKFDVLPNNLDSCVLVKGECGTAALGSTPVHKVVDVPENLPLVDTCLTAVSRVGTMLKSHAHPYYKLCARERFAILEQLFSKALEGRASQ